MNGPIEEAEIAQIRAAIAKRVSERCGVPVEALLGGSAMVIGFPKRRESKRADGFEPPPEAA